MELRQLEYFVAVAEEMNFSRGARRAHVVQSAVSAAVAKLEHELDVSLFERNRHHIALTPAGEALLIEARRTLDAAHRARVAAIARRSQLSGTVDLGMLMNSGSLDLPAILGRFHTQHPLVTVRLRQNVEGTSGHLKAVSDGTLDLALVATEISPRPNVGLRLVASEPLVMLCRPDHVLARRRQVHIGELRTETIVQFAVGWGIRRLTDHAFTDARIEPDAPFEVADYTTAAGLVRHGLGITLMPATPARSYRDLVQIPVRPSLVWTLSLATPTDRQLTAAAAALGESLIVG
ncbi:LysR family transcriptional regulator [Rhodococcus sp. ACT016]|uniref:LysR family transcriptional regulator n=1 Tax=Rhodococcus sp. ACT016 TaxID=3134808 RepID=UPI003D26A6DA